MKKLFIFLTMLVVGIVSSWADDITVTLVDGKTNGTDHDPIGTLMTKDGTTLTSTATSGLKGVVISNVTTSDQGTWNKQRHLTIKPSAGQTAEMITITAPEGYIITGYSINCCNFTSSCVYKIDKSATYNASTATSLPTFSNYASISATFPSTKPLTTSTTAASFWIYAGSTTLYWLMINEFKVTLKRLATPPTSLTSGWYQLSWIGTNGASDYTDADVAGKYVFNYATDVTVNSSNYALYLGDVPSTLDDHAKTFVYIEKNADEGDYGISGNLRSANGRYISRSGASSLIKPDVNYFIYFSSSSYPINSVITSNTSGDDRISLVPQGKSGTPYIGQTNAANKYPMVQFRPVDLSEYDIQAWTVSIQDPAGTHDVGNIQVTYNGADLYGLNKVYHNGTFFIASGTTPSSSDFSAPVKDGVTPAISVDATNHIITATYSVNVTYKMMFNDSEIKSVVVSENIGATASTPSAWTVPAYCSFTCPSTTITAETTEIEVTLNWNGPFDFSTDFASAKWYYMTVNGGYLIYDEDPPYGFCSKEDALGEGSNAIWAFIGDPYNGVRVINKTAGDGKYLNLSSTVQMAEGTYPSYSLCGITENSASETIGFSLDNDGYYLCYYVPEEGDPYLWYGQGKAWAASSQARITVEPYIVTYNLKFGGSTIATKTVDKVTGDSKDLLPSEWERDFCTYSYEPAEIGNSTTSVDVTMTWSGPFDISADYENAVWYYLAVNGKWGKQVTLLAPNIYDDISEVKGLDVGEWAFYGNPYDGFLLSPKAKVNNMFQIYLSSAEETPAFTPATASTEKWVAKEKSGSTFTLNCGDKYLVDNTSTMGFKTTALEGSEGTFSVRSYYCQQALDNWTTYVGESTDKLFGVNPSSASSLDAMIKGSMSKMTQTEYNTNFATIPNANIAGFISYNKPTTGYYRIKNNGTDKYIAYGQPAAPYVEKTAGLIAISSANAVTDVSSIVKLTGSDGTYKLSTEGLNVQPQTTGSQAFPATESEGVDFVFNIATPGIVSITNAASQVNANMDGSLHHATGWTVDGIVNWSASSDNSKWILEDATGFDVAMNGPVDGNYYATLCVPFDVTISDDATAYTLAKSESGNYLVPTEVENNEVPAGTPVLLKGTNETATATINTGSAFNGGSSLDCALTGTYVAKTIDGSNDYVFGRKDGKVGFYHWNSNNLGANRAYLQATTDGARGFSLMFDDEATGIVAPTADTAGETTIYNLSGQRLNKVQKGINIVNGKKVLF